MSSRNVVASHEDHRSETERPTAAPPAGPHTPSGAGASIRARHVLILGGITALGPLATDMYLPALPAVQADLGAGLSAVQLTLTAEIFGLSLGQLIAGPLSDRRGRRLPLLVGLAGFVLASLWCAGSQQAPALAVLRLLQGIGAAAGIVTALGIARDLYGGPAFARFLSLSMTINFLAPAVAPVLGGLLLGHTTWRGIFVALGIIGIALFAAA
ncbi:MAG TPA: MFS transporter, partial [Limnochordia bacterium]